MIRDTGLPPPPAFPYAADPGSAAVPPGERFPRCRDCRHCRANAGDEAVAWYDCRIAEELAGTPAGEINSFARACWHYAPPGDRPVTLFDVVGLVVAIAAAAAGVVATGPLLAAVAVLVLP